MRGRATAGAAADHGPRIEAPSISVGAHPYHNKRSDPNASGQTHRSLSSRTISSTKAVSQQFPGIWSRGAKKSGFSGRCGRYFRWRVLRVPGAIPRGMDRRLQKRPRTGRSRRYYAMHVKSIIRGYNGSSEFCAEVPTMGLLPPLSEVSDRLEVKPTKQQTFALSTLPSSPYGLWKFPRKSARKQVFRS